MRILLVEDDQLLGESVQSGLKHYGYTVDWIQDGCAARTALIAEHFDAVVLDIGLPKASGIEVLKYARQKGLHTPVLLLTALDSIEDRVRGLDAGADDYLTKPFDLDELCARIRALRRRSNERAEPLLTYGAVSLNPASREVLLQGELLVLSRREFSLFHKLLSSVGRVVSRERLTQSMYGWHDDIDSNALEVHIHNLRKKFGDEVPIKTIRGVGYIIAKPSSV